MASATAVSLSANDTRIFHALFDAETSVRQQPVVVQAAKPSLAGFTDEETERLKSEARHALLPVTSVADPPRESIKSALQAISDLIQLEPRFAPAYLDRAQASRLLTGDDELLSGGRPDVLNGVVSDLSAAIKLASPQSSDEPVSNFTAELLSKAHTHLAYLFLKLSQSDPVNPVRLGTETLTRETLEEMAAHHFRLGGLYGNDVARDMAVRTNPYAKMCGAIVKEALRREISGEGAD